jgi:hypothetical protein
VLKKAGVVVAVAAAGLLAASPFASADDAHSIPDGARGKIGWVNDQGSAGQPLVGSLTEAVSAALGPASGEVHNCPGVTRLVVPSGGASAPMTSADVGAGSGVSPSFLEFAAKHHIQWVRRMDCTQGHKRAPARPLLRSAADSTSPNWGGYIANQAASATQIDFTMPGLSQTGGFSGYSSFWAGMGGWNGAPGALIQDGAELDQIQTGSNSARAELYFWYQDIPNEQYEQVISNSDLPLSAGDSVEAWTDYGYNNPGVAEFRICNFTVNRCMMFTENSEAPGNTVEWVAERTVHYSGGTNGTSTSGPMPDFGSVTMSGQWRLPGQTSTDLSSTIADSGAGSVDLTTCAGSTVASAGDLASDDVTFTMTWEDYGSQDPYPCSDD